MTDTSTTSRRDYLATHGYELIDNGFLIVPIEPGEKRPSANLVAWLSIRAEHSTVDRWRKEGKSAHGVGVLTKYTPAVDLDILDLDILSQMKDWCDRNVGATLQRIGRAPKMLLPYRAEIPFPKIRIAYKTPQGDQALEVLGDGQQFVAYAIHPNTGRPYEWFGGELIDTHRDMLPELSHESSLALADFFKSIAPADWELLSDSTASKSIGDGVAAASEQRAPEFKVRSALKYIANDNLHYDDWIRTAYAIRAATAEYPEDGRALFHQWSAKSEKYDAVQTDRAWDSITDVKKIGAGTLFYEAEKHGLTNLQTPPEMDFGSVDVQPPSPELQAIIDEVAAERRAAMECASKPRPARSGRRVLSYDEMISMPEPEWLIEGIIQKRSAALMFGKSNTFKSFLSIDMGLSIATGNDWHGNAVSKGRVLFVATEGANGVGRMRVPGWFGHYDVPVDERSGAFLFPSEISLDEKVDVDWLIAEIGKLGGVDVVVLDIFGGTMSGTEVEDTTARKWVRAVQRIIAETGAAVLTVAHTGWQDETRARMHTHFWGSFDSRLRVEGDKEQMTSCLVVERHKDADSAGSWGFRLEKSHGTLVPVLDESVQPDKGTKWPKAQRLAMVALDVAIAAHGEMQKGDGWPECRVVSVEKWREECDRHPLSKGEADARRMAFNRARDGLIQRKAIQIVNGHVWSTFDAPNQS